ncbi:hypothetical protein J4E06_07135 [Muricauda sp. NFXS6]|uniref:HNH endonuclease n=1 Tax=Allomuricauda sp. NFXS6 TaxID=2819094 RepID=UPI0032DF1643
MTKSFEYPEDEQFFDDLFEDYGGVERNIHLFDFRPSKDKRNEFNKIRNKVFKMLHKQHGDLCQLNNHPDCSNKGTVVDHFIPLSSNKLNKKLRKLKAEPGKKVKTQSFGSNDFENFVLACKRCNANKQNGFPEKSLINKIFSKKDVDV